MASFGWFELDETTAVLGEKTMDHLFNNAIAILTLHTLGILLIISAIIVFFRKQYEKLDWSSRRSQKTNLS